MNPLNHSLLLNKIRLRKVGDWSRYNDYFTQQQAAKIVFHSLESLEDGVFFIGSGNFDEIEKTLSVDPPEKIRLPYDTTWLEFSMRNILLGNKQTVTERWGVLLQQSDKDDLIEGGLFTDRPGFGIVLNVVFKLKSMWTGEADIMMYEPPDSGGLVGAEEMKNLQLSYMSGTTWMLFDFLQKLECKNVKVVHRKVMVKKRVLNKSSHAPTVICKTLVVKHPKKGVVWDSAVTYAGEGAKIRFHSVRGHFNTYGGDSGNGLLFGKHSGRYWWPQHFRGNAKHGVVAKDYSTERKRPS